MEKQDDGFEYVARLHEVMQETGCNAYEAIRKVEEEFRQRMEDMIE